MSILSKLSPSGSPRPDLRTGIRSATGWSRAAVAAHFRRYGLFGRDSSLSSAQQIVVQQRLGRLPGVPEVPAPQWSAARLRRPELLLLADHVDALIAGRASPDDAARLAFWGFTVGAQAEIERTVHNVQDIFGPRTRPAKADVRETVTAEPALARAA